MRYLERLEPLGLLVMRVVLGVIMIGHSYWKVFGGEHKAMAFVTGLGLPWWLTYFSIAAEFGGGILVILGLFTRFSAFAILIDMVVAIWKVHWKNGLLGEHGYQFTLSLSAIAFALILSGAGPIALDSIRRGAPKKTAK